MITKIIYFIESPLRKFDYDRYGIELLKQNGFRVEIWDFTAFLYPQVMEQQNQSDLLRESDLVYTYHSIKDALHSIDRLTEKDLIYIHIGYSVKHWEIYRHVSTSKAFYLVTQLSNIPTISAEKTTSFFKKLKNAINKPSKILNYLFLKIPFTQLGIREADFVLAAGSNSKSSCYPVGKNTNFIWAHTYEYDRFLANNHVAVPERKKNYCVFIDQNIPHHIDFMYDDHGSPCSPEEYYATLEKCFLYIESITNCEVVIAAHPRADISMMQKYFLGRFITPDSIVEVIQHSLLVLAHYSTAILFAVLYNKPVLFLTNDMFKKSEMHFVIENYAFELGRIPINIDRDYRIDISEALLIDSAKYSSYIEHYVKKKDSPQKYSIQILADYLRARK